MEQLSIKRVPMWDSGIIGRGLTYYATFTAILFLKKMDHESLFSEISRDCAHAVMKYKENIHIPFWTKIEANLGDLLNPGKKEITTNRFSFENPSGCSHNACSGSLDYSFLSCVPEEGTSSYLVAILSEKCIPLILKSLQAFTMQWDDSFMRSTD